MTFIQRFFICFKFILKKAFEIIILKDVHFYFEIVSSNKRLYQTKLVYANKVPNQSTLRVSDCNIKTRVVVLISVVICNKT